MDNTNKFLQNLKKREESAAANQADYGSRIPWMKLKEGKHAVRFLPKGNPYEGLPYKEVQVHTLMAKGNNGQKYTAYIICLDWLFTHEGAKENTITPLMKEGKLKKSDITLFKEHGCPICRARQVMMDGGEGKDTYNTCRTRMMAYWNVLVRADRKIFVASLSEQKHIQVSQQIASFLLDEETGDPLPKEQQIDALSMKSGYDFRCTATGNSIGRRYEYMIIPKAKPVKKDDVEDGEKPTDLMLAVGESFRSYQEMCRLLRDAHGKLLSSYAFKYGVTFATSSDSEDDDFDDDEEDDEDTPKKKKVSNDLKSKKRQVVDDDEDEEEDDDEEEESIPVKKKKTPPPQEEDDEDEDEDDEEDEEPAPVSIKKKKTDAVTRVVAKKKKAVVEEEDDDDDDDELPF